MPEHERTSLDSYATMNLVLSDDYLNTCETELASQEIFTALFEPELAGRGEAIGARKLCGAGALTGRRVSMKQRLELLKFVYSFRTV